jgi:hypothetical protein
MEENTNRKQNPEGKKKKKRIAWVSERDTDRNCVCIHTDSEAVTGLRSQMCFFPMYPAAPPELQLGIEFEVRLSSILSL